MPYSDEDALTFISDLHHAHMGCEILIDLLENDRAQTEKDAIHQKMLWDGINIAFRRAFNSSRPMGNTTKKKEYIIRREAAASILKDNDWVPKDGRCFDYFYAIGDKTVAHGNRKKGKYEVLNEQGVIVLKITFPKLSEIKEFQEMCIVLECFAREMSELDPDYDC